MPAFESAKIAAPRLNIVETDGAGVSIGASLGRGRLQSNIFPKPAVGMGYALIETDLRFPAECVDTARIHQLARRSVRLRGVEDKLPAKADNACQSFLREREWKYRSRRHS